MPRTAATDIAETANTPPDDLAALRAELDRLDDHLHDTLIARASVVERLASSVQKGPVALRPGREAAIIRRLLVRHAGPLDAQAVVRIWRELFAATTALQGEHAVAVCDSDPDSSYVQIAREHFGALTPLRRRRSPNEALAEVKAGSAGAAVLPMPSETEPPWDAWWTVLIQDARGAPVLGRRPESPQELALRVVARLPFWASPRPEGAPGSPALVVCAVAPDPSGDDRSLLGVETAVGISRARLSDALRAAGFRVGWVVLHQEPGTDSVQALIDVEGYVTDADPRLEAIPWIGRPPLVLGAYAVPVAGQAV